MCYNSLAEELVQLAYKALTEHTGRRSFEVIAKITSSGPCRTRWQAEDFHAYLFSGPRGRKNHRRQDFAKALGVPPGNKRALRRMPFAGNCRGQQPGCCEIDAASNNGVDEIRDIREGKIPSERFEV